jgi:hypothetical protein
LHKPKSKSGHVVRGQDGEPCRRCGRPSEIREHASITPKVLAQPFYYSRWFFCRHKGCPTSVFYSVTNDFKVLRREPAKPKGFPPLPPDWEWEFDGSVFRPTTPSGVRVPLVDHPFVGNDKERAALKEYQRIMAECKAFKGAAPW